MSIKYTSREFYADFLNYIGITEKDISYSTYKSIIQGIHNEYVAQLHEGKVYRHKSTYQLQVVKYERLFKSMDKKGAIDFHKSKLKKQELIEKGLLPLENYKDEEGKVIGNNGGVDWLVEFTDPFFYSLNYFYSREIHTPVHFKFVSFKVLTNVGKRLSSYCRLNAEKAKIIFPRLEAIYE